MLFLINRNVGNPTLAVIFLTCRFFPSDKINSIHGAGISFLNLIGGLRSGTIGSSSKIFATAFFVRYIFPSRLISTPFDNSVIAFSLMAPST